ncbi:MAG TPA: PmoA family protein [Capsulimonadaceae bacterium]|jgi:hypothetical protein
MSLTSPTISHEIGKAVELFVPSRDECLWRYSYGEKPKPYFHPLRTPAGFCLSLFEPHDHFWHRGLWFTIKFINGENFWEEHVEHGVQRSPTPPTISHPGSDLVVIEHQQLWERPNDAGTVFVEQRRIEYRPLSDAAYALDWEIVLVAQSDLLLDRTPFTTWGGYGGLTMRGNRNWQQTNLLFADGSTSDRPLGVPSNWCDLSGVFDGGRDSTGGVAIFDHPDNVRHPSPWYGGTGSGHYFNAAFLFHEPMSINEGDSLRFRYRVLVHDGEMDVDALNKAYELFVSQPVDLLDLDMRRANEAIPGVD